jgi:hypothetical protein
MWQRIVNMLLSSPEKLSVDKQGIYIASPFRHDLAAYEYVPSMTSGKRRDGRRVVGLPMVQRACRYGGYQQLY